MDSKDALERMIEDIQRFHVLVIDYKEHTFRSYLGFICLMMVKTEETLYVLDGIKLRSHLIDLIRITINPCILKVVP